MFSIASSKFLLCSLVFYDMTVKIPSLLTHEPPLSIIFYLVFSLKKSHLLMLSLTTALEDVLLTFWPPGP